MNRVVTSLYRRDEAIGRGNFGVVYKGVNLETRQVVAIKVLNLDTVEDEVLDVQHEITMLSRLSQSDAANITKYYGSYLHGTRLWIIMDLCAGGSVRTLLKAGRIEEKYTAVVVRELLQALTYIHKEGIIHRDIKAANVLITKEGKVRLCDFGVAAQVTSTKLKRSTIVGTPYWMAPEVITEGAMYNSKADIWSLGITIYEIATGNPPYSDQEAFRAIMLIPRQKPARLEGSMYSSSLKEFVAQCLDEHPQARPSAEELTKLKFVKSSRSTPTSILRDLVARYMNWRERHSNVRDSIAILNSKPIPENGEDDFVLGGTSDDEDYTSDDTVWDFDIDPSTTSIKMADVDNSTITTMIDPNLVNYALMNPYSSNHNNNHELTSPPSMTTMYGSHTPSPVSLDYPHHMQQQQQYDTVGLGLSDITSNNVNNTSMPSYPGSRLQSRESTIRPGGLGVVGGVTFPPTMDAPQSLMELFEDASVSNTPRLMDSGLEPHAVGGLFAGPPSLASPQPTTPTIEIEIPTFEAITASANAFAANSNNNTTMTATTTMASLTSMTSIAPAPTVAAALSRNVPPPLPIIPPPPHGIINNPASASSSSSMASSSPLAAPPSLGHHNHHPHMSPIPSPISSSSLSPVVSSSSVSIASSSVGGVPGSHVMPNHRRSPSPKRMTAKLAIPPSPPKEVSSPPPPSGPASASVTMKRIGSLHTRPKLKAINNNNMDQNSSDTQLPLQTSPQSSQLGQPNLASPMTSAATAGSPQQQHQLQQLQQLQQQQIGRAAGVTSSVKTQPSPGLLRQQPSQSLRGRERDGNNLRIAMPPPPIQFTSFGQQQPQQPHQLHNQQQQQSQSPPIGLSLGYSSVTSSISTTRDGDSTLEDIVLPSYDGNVFPTVPKLNMSVLLDSTPKHEVAIQLDELLNVFTIGLDRLSASLEAHNR